MKFDANDFYNSEQKIEFLNSIGGGLEDDKSYSFCRLFVTTKLYENKFNTDICNFSYDRYLTVFPFILGKNLNSKRASISLLTQYVNWCISNKKSIRMDNPLLGVDATKLNSYIKTREQMISSPEQLNAILDVVLSPIQDDNTLDIMLRICCLLLFGGFSIEEAASIEKEDIDFNNNIIYNHPHTKTISLTPDLKILIQSVIDLEEITSVKVNGMVKRERLEDNNRLLRRTARSNQGDIIYKYRVDLSVLKRKYYTETYEKISLSPKNLYESGIFYRLWQKEQNGAVLTDDDFSYNVDEQSGEWLTDKLKINKAMYSDWKETFYS